MAAAFVTHAIDTGTAAACRDHERLKAMKEPERRRAWVRLAVVLIVLAFTAWAVEWIAVNSKGFHYKEVAYDSKEARAYFLPVPAGSFLSASSDGMIPNNISCPCLGQPSMSWCSFIDFYFITCNQETNYQLRVTPISTPTNSSSCQRQPPNISFACQNASNLLSCSSALDVVYDFPNTNTHIQTVDLASPFRVFDLVSTNMQSNIQINNETMYAKALNSSNQKEYNHSMLILSLVQSMAAQVFDCNTSSTVQQFWDRANRCGWDLYPQVAAQFNGNTFAFGMTINYQAYSTTCKPDKCYILVKDSFNTRLLRAMGEVGGVGSLILLGIQIVLWPLVAKICKFPFEHDLQAGAVASALNNIV